MAKTWDKTISRDALLTKADPNFYPNNMTDPKRPVEKGQRDY